MVIKKIDFEDFLDGAGHIGLFPSGVDYKRESEVVLKKLDTRNIGIGMPQNERHLQRMTALRRSFFMHSMGQVAMVLVMLGSIVGTVYLSICASTGDGIASLPVMAAAAILAMAKIRFEGRRLRCARQPD